MEAKKQIEEQGYYEFRAGVYVQSSEDIQSSMKESGYPDELIEPWGAHQWWIITDDGNHQGFQTVEQAVEALHGSWS